MSDRTCLGHVNSSVIAGDALDLYRDNESKSYRLFTYDGHRDVTILGRYTGHQFDDCTRCELSFDDLQSLKRILDRAVESHQPWPDYSEESEDV
jgi:hypothetical protein